MIRYEVTPALLERALDAPVVDQTIAPWRKPSVVSPTSLIEAVGLG